MTSITDQKAELKEDIVGLRVDIYLGTETPTKEYIVAMLTRRLAKTLTLSELQYWRGQLEKDLER